VFKLVLIISQKTKPPGAVGVSIALEKFLPNNPASDVGLPRLHNSSYTSWSRKNLFMHFISPSNGSMGFPWMLLLCLDFRIEHSISVLVCSKGGGGLLNERMELVEELWEANIKVCYTEVMLQGSVGSVIPFPTVLIDFYYYQAQFVPQEDPSLQEQYEYASDHDIKCLVFITEGLSQTDLVKVNMLRPCYLVVLIHC
jgi:translation initiation factor 2-alpha kinase 4